MTKRLLISLLALTMGLHLTGCTSDNAAEDTDESVVSSDDSFNQENSGDFEEGGGEQAAAEGTEGGESVDDTAIDDGTAPTEEGGDVAATPEGEAAPADATTPAEGGESDELALDDGTDPANEFPDEVAGTDAAPADPAAPTDETATSDTAATTGEQPTDAGVFDPAAGGDQPADQASSEPPPVDDSASADTSMGDTAAADTPTYDDTTTTDVVASEPAPKPYLPLLKVKDAPFENGGTLLNRYYIAREGDTTKSVSEKIYGSNRSRDLKKWNVLLANRPMKVGDKVYYNSPKDPADSSKMISWYEEQGVAPSTYTAQEGDDIRELSKQLLGNTNSWKELWATNMDVESKGSLPAGTELRYYPQGASEQAVASNSAPPPADMAAPPADMGTTDTAATQPMDQGLPPDDPTLNPPMDMNANAGTVAPPQDFGAPPPPPPDMAQAAPPPPPMEPMQAPPPPKPTTRAAAADEEMAGDPDQTMMLGAAGLLLLGGVLAFSVIRRKRASKRIDMTQTQI